MSGRSGLHPPVHLQRAPRARQRCRPTRASADVGLDADDDQHDVGGGAETGFPDDRQPLAVSFDRRDRHAVPHGDAVPLELLAHQDAELRIDRGQDIRKLLDDPHGEPARPQGLRHLEPDVAGADDDRALGPSRQRLVQHEAVADRVQLKDALAL